MLNSSLAELTMASRITLTPCRGKSFAKSVKQKKAICGIKPRQEMLLAKGEVEHKKAIVEYKVKSMLPKMLHSLPKMM